ncbi:MAG: hypothetical protein IJA10_09020 [Lachnospiraceae bacterium]|nr:hypothetical protein [Lachnospiraceae bacterium]
MEYRPISSKVTYDLAIIVYGYDSYGRVGSITTKVNGTETGTTSYEYDLMVRVVRVIAHDGTATVYEYDAIGNRTAVRHEGGLTVSYEYDTCSRLINEIVTDKDSNVLMFYHYTYGNAGEKTQAVEVVRESANDTTVTVICNDYSYDNLLRLTGETIQVAENVPFDTVVKGTAGDEDSGNETTENETSNDGSSETGTSAEETGSRDSGTESTNTIDITGITWDGSIVNQYTYDAVSNRTGKVTTVNGTVYEMADSVETGTTVYTYNELNQLISAENGDTTITYTYDINGNLVSEHGGSEDKTYTYDTDNRLMIVTLSSGNNVTIESYTYDYEGNRISKQLNEDGKIYYLNDTFQYLTQVALELKKQEDGSYGVNKYYTRGTELIKADIYEDSEGNQVSETYTTKQYIMDGHGSVTALAETNEVGNVVTDTYTYDAYGNLLKKTGTTENDYLYTGEQYNEATGLYYLRARYMNPETGTFISMDSYAGSLDNPVSLHKYLYANANPVMYTDPTGYFSLAESSVVQGMKSVLNTGMQSLGNLKKVMSWANMAVTLYDIHEQIQLLQSGEGSVLGLVLAIAGGIATQALLNCALTKLLGSAAVTVLKVIGVAQDAGSFLEAVKSGDPEKIVVETVRLIVSLFTLKCQCFTGETLVSTTEGNKRIDEIKVGDYVYAYDTEKEENVLAKVTYVSITETDILVHVYTSEGEEIKTTMFHPFYVKNVKNGAEEEYGAWKAASNLVNGDELLTEDGRIVYVKEVRIERLAESIKVYNLEVEGLHTYYVGSGILVHNRCPLGKNMVKDPNGIGDPGLDFDAHHIFPQKFRYWFNKIGIDIDDPDFGIWLEKSEHLSNAKSYNKLWEKFFSRYNFNPKKIDIADVFAYLDEIGRMW